MRSLQFWSRRIITNFLKFGMWPAREDQEWSLLNHEEREHLVSFLKWHRGRTVNEPDSYFLAFLRENKFAAEVL